MEVAHEDSNSEGTDLGKSRKSWVGPTSGGWMYSPCFRVGIQIWMFKKVLFFCLKALICVDDLRIWILKIEKTNDNLPSLKLTARTSKLMVGRLLCFWEDLLSSVFAVSFREGNFCWKYLPALSRMAFFHGRIPETQFVHDLKSNHLRASTLPPMNWSPCVVSSFDHQKFQVPKNGT